MILRVLVRTGREGKLIKEALANQGVASVYLSNRDSVFDSEVAQDVLRLLMAVASPSDEYSLRAILACDLFALNMAQLDQFNHDENAWENVVNEFEQYHQLWLKRGVLPMMRAVISQRQIAERWLLETHGERKLTDLLHLSELVQQASLSLEGESALIRWLAENIEQHDGEISEQTQRLEVSVTWCKSSPFINQKAWNTTWCSYRLPITLKLPKWRSIIKLISRKLF